MTTIIMSIRGRHIRNMEAGKKAYELRKTRPGRPGPYRVLLCQTGTGGKIVARFTCEAVVEMDGSIAETARLGCVTEAEARAYRKDGTLYGWLIREFEALAPLGEVSWVDDWGLNRPPQSWCYAREKGPPG